MQTEPGEDGTGEDEAWLVLLFPLFNRACVLHMGASIVVAYSKYNTADVFSLQTASPATSNCYTAYLNTCLIVNT